MIHIRRTTIALTVLTLLAPGLNRVARSQTPASPEVSKKTFIITGSTGVGGVTFKSLPGDPISDEHGNFAIEVPNDLNGYVMPIKEGYTFNPPFVAFGPANRVNNISFTAKAWIHSRSPAASGSRVSG